jgi:ribosomal-protein-alanine N-acetyltransferase
MQIRKWQAGDFDALHALDRACFPPPIAYSRRTLRKFLRLPGAECLVAECDGRIGGFILTHAGSAKPRTPPHGHIISLDVDANFRRRGVGSALLRAAEELLASGGVRTIDLETAVSNQSTLAFWRGHGYEIIGQIADYYDDRADAFAMSKELSQTMTQGEGRTTSPNIATAPHTTNDHQSEESESTCTYTRR